MGDKLGLGVPVGDVLGWSEGDSVGSEVVGDTVGPLEGVWLDFIVGDLLGAIVMGEALGLFDGIGVAGATIPGVFTGEMEGNRNRSKVHWNDDF